MSKAQLAALTTGLILLAGCTSGGSDSPTVTGALTSPASPTSTGAPSTEPASTEPSSTGQQPAFWSSYHGDPQRTGYAAAMPAATGRLTAKPIALGGQVYASPLVLGDTVVVATERNDVYGLNLDGGQKWKLNLGTPTNRADLPCGNIDPLGITGTPVYDPATKSVFAVASIGSPVRHDLVAIDPATGALRWRRSIDLPGVDAQAMQERGALTVLAGRVWVPFGGLAGDCGNYKGRLVGVPTGNGMPIEYTVPTTREAGIWTPPGPTVHNGQLLVAVGNGESTGGQYDFSDSVLRISTGGQLVDSFSPTTWATDNAADLDLGSQGPAVVDNRWVFSAGKSGTGYVLAAGRFGGIGGQVWQGPVCKSFGGTAVVGNLVFVPCTDGVRAVQLSATGQATVRWQAADSVAGSPVVGGGRVYAIDQSANQLVALDPASGKVRERVSVGELSRFATAAIGGSRLYVPTLAGITVVHTS